MILAQSGARWSRRAPLDQLTQPFPGHCRNPGTLHRGQLQAKRYWLGNGAAPDGGYNLHRKKMKSVQSLCFYQGIYPTDPHMHTKGSHLQLASKVRSEMSKGPSMKSVKAIQCTGTNTRGQSAGLALTEFLGAGTPGSHRFPALSTQCFVDGTHNQNSELPPWDSQRKKAGLGGSSLLVSNRSQS